MLATDDGRPVPRAQGPHRLWPERSPAPPEPDEVRATDGPTRVAGLAVPKGALRGVRPLDVLRADLGPGAGQPGEGVSCGPRWRRARIPRPPGAPYGARTTVI